MTTHLVVAQQIFPDEPPRPYRSYPVIRSTAESLARTLVQRGAFIDVRVCNRTTGEEYEPQWTTPDPRKDQRSHG